MDILINFKDLVNLEIISNFSKVFFSITGLICDIEDLRGEHPKKYYSDKDENCYCRLIKSSKSGLAKCIKTGKLAGLKAAKLKKPVIAKCHAGLIDIYVPILIGGEHIATLATGQILDSNPTFKMFKKIESNISSYNIDSKKLEEAFYSTHVIERSKLNNYIDLMSMLISYVVEIEDKILFINKNKPSKYQIEKAKNFIKENYNKKIYLDEVAKISNLSKYYFVRLFKKEVGITFTEYLNLFRITMSKKMLTGNKSIINVCFDVGFNSLPHFYKKFKNQVGITPKEYRKN